MSQKVHYILLITNGIVKLAKRVRRDDDTRSRTEGIEVGKTDYDEDLVNKAFDLAESGEKVLYRMTDVDADGRRTVESGVITKNGDVVPVKKKKPNIKESRKDDEEPETEDILCNS